MGACFSSSSSSTFNTVRVIHINGFVEEFEPPMKAGQVIKKQPKHVLCSSAHLLSGGSLPNLRPADMLQPGCIYFLLPHAVFHSDSSADIALLVTRLMATARAGPTSLSGRHGGPEEPARRSHGGGGQVSSRWLPDLSPIVERSKEVFSSSTSSVILDSVPRRSGSKRI